MKKFFCLILLIIFLVAVSTCFCLLNIHLFKENNGYYKFFNEKKLVGVDGNINLSGIVQEREASYRELLDLFQQENYGYDIFLKLLKDKKDGNDALKEEIYNLSNESDKLENKRNELNSEYDVLYKKYDNIRKSSNNVVTVNTNNSYNFPLINQYPKYQTGCESVSLTMLLRYYGVSVTPDMIISKLTKGSLPYFENGVLYGGNPEVEFVGNPYLKTAYGAYEKPMAEVANMFKSGVIAKSDFSFNEVVNLVQNGTPVMVWTSMGLSLPYISSSWIYKPTGETVSWKANEHAVVMVGVSDSTVTVADPMGGKLKTYSRSTFENRYNYYGKKALYYL